MPLNDPPWRAPCVNLLANGEVLQGVIEIAVRSNNHYGADTFRASIALSAATDRGAELWSRQLDIQIDIQLSLDGGNSFVSLIRGAVDVVEINPITNILHIDGRDLSAGLIEARSQEAFANRTASEVAELLAERHGLTPQVTATSTPIGRYYQSEHDTITLDQFSRATTEWDLLVFLARQEGFDVFVRGAKLFFQPTTDDSDATVRLLPTDLIELRLMRSLTLARDIEVTVKSWNSYQNSSFIQGARASCRYGSVSPSVQRYVFVRPNLTPSDALKLAQRKVSELARHERVIELTMPGELVLTPRSMISLQGTNTDFDQTYYIDVIDRRLSFDSGFIQRILARNSSPRLDMTFTR